MEDDITMMIRTIIKDGCFYIKDKEWQKVEILNTEELSRFSMFQRKNIICKESHTNKEYTFTFSQLSRVILEKKVITKATQQKRWNTSII